MNMTVLFKKCTYWLLLIATTLIWLWINFSSAWSYTYTWTVVKSISSSSSTSNWSFQLNFNLPLINHISDTIANQIDNLNCNFSNIKYWNLVVNEIRISYNSIFSASAKIWSTTFNWDWNYNFDIDSNISQILSSLYLSFRYTRPNTTNTFSLDYSCTFSWNNIINQADISGWSSNCTQCESDLTTCQSDLATATWSLTTCQWMYDKLDSDYDLLEWNYNTCTSELNICLQNWWSSWSWDIQWSSLFINNIQHIGAWIINISIPEEIERDYTTDENTFDLTVEWYWYDEEKITNIITTQNYKPTPEEMSELVGKFADFLPLVAITLLILRAWRLIKKIF